MEEKIRNTIVDLTNGDTLLIYNLTLSFAEIRHWFEDACEQPVEDIYNVDACEIQYYIIDGRIWADTPAKEASLREYMRLNFPAFKIVK